MLKKLSLIEFKDKLASNEAVPGGGAVAAVCGSLGAALGSMVCRLTEGKKNYEEQQGHIKELVKKLDEKSHVFMDLIDEDANAFNDVMIAFKLPKDSLEDKEKRTEAIQLGMKKAAEVPLKIARLADTLFEHFDYLVVNGNKNAQTDALVGVMLARTTVLAALYNVKINLASIKDESYVNNMRNDVLKLEKRAKDTEELILSKSDL